MKHTYAVKVEFQVGVVELANYGGCNQNGHFDGVHDKQSCAREAVAYAVEEQGNSERHYVDDNDVLPGDKWKRAVSTWINSA